MASHAEGYFFFFFSFASSSSSCSRRRRTLVRIFSTRGQGQRETDKTTRPPPYWVLLRSVCVLKARAFESVGWVGG
jgi:hypothetical protein